MADIKIIRSSELTTSQWSGGTTTQLYIWPEDTSYAERNFLWRLSTARVDAEVSSFTSLPGISRTLMVLDGVLYLEHEGHYGITLRRFDQDRFMGDWNTTSRGRVTDFNLMISNGEGSVEAMKMEAGGSETISNYTEPSRWRYTSRILYPLSGDIMIPFPGGRDIHIGKGDLFIVRSSDKEPPLQLEVTNSPAGDNILINTLVCHQ